MSDRRDIEARLRDAVEALPPGLRDHVLRVEQESLRLAALHGVDADRAGLAALGHDLVRHKKGQELHDLAVAYGIVPDAVERRSPILVHGPIAARMLDRDYALADDEILEAIDCHTTARPDMSPLESVLFVADKIEAVKLATHPAYQDVFDLALTDLNAAVLRYLDLNLEQAVRRHWPVHDRSHQARNHLLLAAQSLSIPA
jgi:predicted HD superfamily hydrolase involved in NAD metabolism